MKPILVALLSFTAACTAPAVTTQPEPQASMPSESATPAVDKVNSKNFAKVWSGMTLAQAEAVLGKGDLSSEVEAAGSGKFSTYIWTSNWTSQTFAIITITFLDGVAQSKAQFGLK